MLVIEWGEGCVGNARWGDRILGPGSHPSVVCYKWILLFFLCLSSLRWRGLEPITPGSKTDHNLFHLNSYGCRFRDLQRVHDQMVNERRVGKVKIHEVVHVQAAEKTHEQSAWSSQNSQMQKNLGQIWILDIINVYRPWYKDTFGIWLYLYVVLTKRISPSIWPRFSVIMKHSGGPLSLSDK